MIEEARWRKGGGLYCFAGYSRLEYCGVVPGLTGIKRDLVVEYDGSGGWIFVAVGKQKQNFIYVS